MIRVNCPACKKRLKVPFEGAGRTVKCPRCQTGVVVPNEAPLPMPVIPEPELILEIPPEVPAVPQADWPEEELGEFMSAEPVFTKAEVNKSFQYVTEDPSWLSKVLVGGLIISFPILEAVCDGYQIRTIRNMRAGRKEPLPTWDDLGGLFMQGLPLRLAIYAMYIPAMILSLFTFFVDWAWIAQYLLEDEEARKNVSIMTKITRWLLLPLLNLFVVVVQAVLFFTVPALARRVADGESFFSLFNPMPTIKLIVSNLTIYISARLVVFVLIFVFSIVAGGISGVGWVVVIGPVFGWLILGIGRFWGRQVWAYYLAHMNVPSERVSL